MRLFVAVDLPDVTKNRLSALHDAALTGAQWTKAQQWHLTLHFIGERADDAAIRQALALVCAEPFQVSLQRVGTFPDKGKPRVLWVGVEAPPALQTLHEAVGAALYTTGFEPDSRPYSPHITLARFKERTSHRDVMHTYLTRHSTFQTDVFAIEHFTLYESELQPGGSVYRVRENYRLTT